jgi:hypothetical protein
MNGHQLSDEAVAIGTVARDTELLILKAAARTDKHSIILLGLATILAALPTTAEVDLIQIEGVLQLLPGETAGGLRFVEFVRSLSIWADAIAPEGTEA